MNKIIARWQDWRGTGLEHLVITEEPFLIVDGVLQNQDGVTSIRAEQVRGMRGAGSAGGLDDIDFDAHNFY